MFHIWRSSTTAKGGSEGSNEREGGPSWLKGRQNSNYFIMEWHDSSNIKAVLCAVCLSVEQMSSPKGEQTATLSLRLGCIAVFLSFSDRVLFSSLSHLFNILIHSTCNYFKNKFSADKKNKKNWASWVTQMTSLFLLEDKVFITSLVGLLHEVSEFE